ncbi:hypothetical protein BKA69DRAFT_1084905 [Paraphysoderma sedebokerense]|nr:hypothetical protein BKA69DRAFT_1084905 [Paraphysoderma sedebokerense]
MTSTYTHVLPIYDIAHFQSHISSWSTDPSLPHLDKYFTRRYFVPKSKEGDDLCEDQYVHQCPNKLCVIGLHPSHRLFAHLSSSSDSSDESSSPPTITSITISQSLIHTNSTVSGKRKKNAVTVLPYTDIGIIKCSDGMEFKIRSCVKGHLLEVNEDLVKNPEKLTTRTLTEGWVAVVRPFDEDLRGLVKSEDYATIRNSDS